MVSRGKFNDGVFKARPVLSDVTNRTAKRPFSSNSADFVHKSGVENLVTKKRELQFGPSTPQNDIHPSLTLSFPSVVPATSLQNLSSQKLNPPRSVTEEQDLLAESFLGLGEDSQQGRITCDASEGRTLTEVLNNVVVQSGDREEGCVVDKLASSKFGSVETPTNSYSRDFGFQGLERCSLLKGVSAVDPTISCSDLLKHCTCSFCSKAAYIWTDLHYQDVKSRVGAVKKSQKESGTMLQKFITLKDKLIHDPPGSAESTKLELSLMEQWKSLFVYMENTFAQESKQLESSLGPLKDLRMRCKNDLDLTENSHSNYH